MNPYLIYLPSFVRTYYAFLLCDLPSQYGMVFDRPHLQMPLVEIVLRPSIILLEMNQSRTLQWRVLFGVLQGVLDNPAYAQV